MAYTLEVESSDVTELSFQEMPIGSIGIVVDHDYEGHVVLRYYDGVVSLTNPEENWSVGAEVHVRPLENATVTLTFGDGGRTE